MTLVQAALFMFGSFPPPSPGTNIFPGFDCARTGRAADRGVSLVVQAIVRNLIFFYIVSHVVECPRGEWVDFGNPAVRIVFLDSF